MQEIKKKESVMIEEIHLILPTDTVDEMVIIVNWNGYKVSL